MSVGKAFLRIRQDKGLTQARVAERAGLATSYISRIENNRVQPTMTTVERLAQALGISVSSVFRIGGQGDARGAHGCPISSSGVCIGEQIRSHHGHAPLTSKNLYGKEELRVLRMTDFLLTQGPKDLRRALTVVVESLVNQAKNKER
jgi:DNA-binding XRE family transcriptional regulator